MLHPPPPMESGFSHAPARDRSRVLRAMILLCGWAWSVLAFFPSTNAAWSLSWQALLIPTGLVIGICWAAYSGNAAAVFASWRSTILWLSVPVLAAAVLMLSASNLGFAARIWLCEEELQAFAEAARAGKVDVGASGPNDCTVGLFHIDRTNGFGTDVNMVTARGLFETHGITYWPEMPPDQRSSRIHLFGPWYRHYDDW